MNALAEKNKIFDGRNGVARNVVVVPLTPDINSVEVAERISSGLEGVQEGMGIISIPKFRQKLRLFVPEFANFYQIMDAARSADFVLFVHSAIEEIKDYGEQIIRCITSQGVSTSFGAIWRLQESNSLGNKEKGTRDSLTSWFNHFFPNEKLFDLDNLNELNILGRSICQKTPRGVHWRDERAYVVAEQIEVSENQFVFTGSIRGKHLSISEFMHVPGYGDFKVSKVEKLTSNTNPDAIEQDVWVADPTLISNLVPESEQIELTEFDETEHVEGQGIRVDGHEDITYMVENNVEDNAVKQPKTLPEGTSEYQAAWFIDGVDYASDEESQKLLSDEEGELVDNNNADMDDDMDDVEEDVNAQNAEDEDDDMEDEFDYNYSREAKDDMEFPDEIEIDPAVRASERLKRYRGVRSIRHTDWDSREQDPRMPSEFTRLYRPGNLIARSNLINKQFTNTLPLGAKVRVYLTYCDFDNSSKTAESMLSDWLPMLNAGQSVTAYALLPSEEKLGYVNTSITLDSEITDPIKSKQPIIIQYGPRRMLINPLFSQPGHSDNNVYKFFRFLHPGRTATITFIGPVLLSNAPVVYYSPNPLQERKIIGAGTVLDSDADRIIVKTAILTGLPVKIHRKLITIKHMFFSREDVEYFKQVPLFTKMGAQGFIKEALGTHGLFKATFDKKIQSADTIGIAVYKRVWPKIAQIA